MKNFMEGFEPADYKRWQNKIAEDLQKIKLETTLIKQDYEGLQIQPLYASDNISESLQVNNIPGHFPYMRSDQVYPKPVSLVHRVQGQNYSEINTRVKNAVTGGADTLLLNLDHSKESYIDLLSGEEFFDIFKDVDLTKISVAVDMGEDFLLKTLFIYNVLKKNNLLERNLKIDFKIDPISFWAKNGEIHFDLDFYYSNLCELLEWKKNTFPESKFIEVNSSVYHNAGASEEQEIAFTLAIAVEYLRRFHSYGMNLVDAVSAMSFKMSYDANFFTGIAKTRALRWCLSRVFDELDIDTKISDIHINAQTSRRMLTIYDPWVNLLRSTLASFSSMNSAVNSLEVFNFDLILNETFSKSERNDFTELSADKLSRNTYHILKDESLALSVIDPAGGSYYVEELTHQMSQKSWEIFQEIEKSGGFVECLKNNIIQSMLDVTKSKRTSRVRFKLQNCTGVNDFPNKDERLLDNWNPKEVTTEHIYKEYKKQGKDLSKLVTAIRDYKYYDKGNSLLGELEEFLVDLDEISLAYHSLQGHQELNVVDAIPRFRESKVYEDLRLAVENHGELQPVKVLCIGNRAKLSPRLAFTINYFEVAGLDCEIEYLENLDDIGIISSDIVALCASDKDYETILAHDNFEQIVFKNLVVAGKHSNELITYNIYKKQDSIEILSGILKTMGVL